VYVWRVNAGRSGMCDGVFGGDARCVLLSSVLLCDCESFESQFGFRNESMSPSVMVFLEISFIFLSQTSGRLHRSVRCR
jgi:hypothetical protein